ncbi:MAG: undecaprenyl/decaprenyl-phosphate alpha-N-acetylglucosaminyl 1-phosphate transferase [Phycisphaeraceae bacterium]|nr:undecaprenyl/decaprenyl-phosphate alpha-N-acetylglucosaminyl 1-phosphate transferase [Phycisphaeraceae bacterium]
MLAVFLNLEYQPLIYALLLFVGLLLSLPLTYLMIAVGRRLGRLDLPNPNIPHKVDSAGIPNTGGVAIVISMLVVWFLAALIHPPNYEVQSPGKGHSWFSVAPIQDDPPLTTSDFVESPSGDSISKFNGDSDFPMVYGAVIVPRPAIRGVLALMIAIFLIHLLGLWDDRRPLAAAPKLAGQLLVALFLTTIADVRVLQLIDHWGIHGVLLSHIITVLWILLIVNAINFMDNMDGLAAGTAIIIAGLYLAAGLLTDQTEIILLACGIIAAAGGFLWFNRHPAQIYMGDSGSMALGLALAIISIRTTYFDPEGVRGGADQAHAILMPLVLLAVPLYDLASVCLLRIRQGKSIWIGDKQHLSHRLVKRGYPVGRAVAVIWLCVLATGLGGIMFGTLSPWQARIVALQAVAVLALLALLELRVRETDDHESGPAP